MMLQRQLWSQVHPLWTAKQLGPRHQALPTASACLQEGTQGCSAPSHQARSWLRNRGRWDVQEEGRGEKSKKKRA